MDLRGPDFDHCLLKDTRRLKKIPEMSEEEYQKAIDDAYDAYRKVFKEYLKKEK